MVGLRGFAFGLGEEVDHQAKVKGAGAGGKCLFDLAAVGHQRKLVSGAGDNLRQHHGRGGCLVELGYGQEMGGVLLGFRLVEKVSAGAQEVECGARKPAGVEHDPDLLGAFDGELAGDEVAAAGGGCPGDVAELVALLVVAEAFKTRGRRHGGAGGVSGARSGGRA